MRADILLLLSAAIWGFAFVAQRMGMESMGPLMFNGIRFGMGTLVVGGFILVNRGTKNEPRPSAPSGSSASHEIPSYIGPGIMIGLVLFLGATLQQMGIVYTTAGNAGFITGLYVILVPVIGIFIGHRAGLPVWAGALLAVAGLYLLSITNSFALAKGDALVMMSAMVWAVHVLMIGHYSPQTDPVRLALVQFLVCGLLSIVSGLIFENNTAEGIRAAFWPLLYGGFLSVGLGFTLQVVAQKDAPPARAAIILSLEAVFALIGGMIILSEDINLRKGMGCLLMLGGMIVSQVGRNRGGG